MPAWAYLPWITVIVGIWLVISPWVLNYAGDQPAMLNAVICGVILALVGLFAGYFARRPGMLR